MSKDFDAIPMVDASDRSDGRESRGGQLVPPKAREILPVRVTKEPTLIYRGNPVGVNTEKVSEVEIRRYTNRKGNTCEGVFVSGQLAHPLNGFVQVRRGLVAHGCHLGDRLGWLYTVILCLTNPVGTQRGGLRIGLGVLAFLLGKSVSQIRRDLKKLADHPRGYICYRKATGRYDAMATIVIPKYGKTGG